MKEGKRDPWQLYSHWVAEKKFPTGSENEFVFNSCFCLFLFHHT